MFWANSYNESIDILMLLDKQNLTLHELMDSVDILQECKGNNKKLVEFLLRSDIMEELVDLTTMEPSSELEERLRYKYSNIACELLTSDIPKLNEKLAGDENLLNKLYSFIDTDQPLNPLLASFFSKTIHALVRRTTDQNWYSYQCMCLQVLEFLKSRQRCVDLLLQHIETSAIMDLVLILLTKIEGCDMKQNILKWLDSQQLVQRLVQLLSPHSEHAKHTNASQLLCDIITSARMAQNTSTIRLEPDPILICIESEEIINILLETMLSGEKVESSIVGGIQVLLTLIGQKGSKKLDEKESYGYPLDNIVEDEKRDKIANVIVVYLDQFINLLLEPPYKPVVKTTAGLLETPFGITRLQIVKLLAALLSMENVKIRERFAESDTFQVLLDLFFIYSWNNFLHTQVQQCLAFAINCDCPETNEKMYAHIFVQSKLIDRILEAWKVNTCNKQNDVKVIRQGYMGHLICMVNNIVTQSKNIPTLENFLKENLSEDTLTEWEKIVSVDMEEINKTQQLDVGGPPEDYAMSSDGNSNAYSNESSFPSNNFQTCITSNYQDQSSVPVNFDQYGYCDEKCNVGDDDQKCIKSCFAPNMNIVTFNVSDDDLKRSEELFNKVCDEKRDMKDATEEDWYQSSNSSDEEDEECSALGLDRDFDPWGSSEVLSGTMPTVSLWNAFSMDSQATGWANFDNALSNIEGTQHFGEPITNTEVPSTPKEREVPLELPVDISGCGDQNVASEPNIDVKFVDKNPSPEQQAEVPEMAKISANDSDNNANPLVTEFSISKKEDGNCAVEETVPKQSEAAEAPGVVEESK